MANEISWSFALSKILTVTPQEEHYNKNWYLDSL